MLPVRLERWVLLAAAGCSVVWFGCDGRVASVVAPAEPPSEGPAPNSSAHHHHELNLPPVGPLVSVVYNEFQVDVRLTDLSDGTPTIPLLKVWTVGSIKKFAPSGLNFDLFGSDGFHPSDRAPCARLLTAKQMAAAHINVVTHDITFDPGLSLPGCYRVRGVVRLEASTPSPPAYQPEPAALTPGFARCSPVSWTQRAFGPLLKAGKGPPSHRENMTGSAQVLFNAECTDSPSPPGATQASPVVVEGIEVRLASALPAGTSGRRWPGNQCAFDVRIADGSGVTAHLGAAEVPPFNTVNALVRSGSAVWLSVGFNGYAREFPKGGNRIVALDLCAGRVVWQSNNATSNGGLLMVDDYILSPYGFTSEPRSVFVFDGYSGQQIQKLPVIENVCPSESWAPNWHPGERCDAPGQRVGAATNPRLNAGRFVLDTNTGSSVFSFL
jgi:hypothetical protein